jgi:DNA-binding CsgD family transcriptional regulator/uncharacterized membrane protein
MWRPIRIGPAELVEARSTVETAYDLLLIGSFLTLMTYNLFLFRFGRGRVYASLFLALVFLSLAVRISVVGQMITTQIIPGFPWALQLRIEYLTGHLALFAYLWAFSDIYPRTIPRWFCWAVTCFVAANALATLFGSVLFYSRLVPIYGYTMVGVIVIVTAILFRRAVSGVRAAWVGFGSSVIALIMAASEQLHYQEILLSREFAPFGFLVSVLGSDTLAESSAYVVSTSLNVAVLFLFASLTVAWTSRKVARIAGLELGDAADEEGAGDSSELPYEQVRERLRRDFGITKREAEIVELVAEGKTNPEIGARLFVSVATVKTHVYRIMRKLEASSRNEVGRIYLELKWNRRV